jgi:hypothetical protein
MPKMENKWPHYNGILVEMWKILVNNKKGMEILTVT